MSTTKLKLKWLQKRRQTYRNKIDRAFAQTKREIVGFLNDIKGEPDYFLKYLAMCIDTSDPSSFIKMMQGIIEDAKKCKGDPQANKAVSFCNYILFRLYWLSNFTIQWTNITIKCYHCKKLVHTNLLFSDKLCPYCGHIIL